ncbi:N-acetyllactosaminide beta-1,3-N-acetylglucosaminyltransferase 3-like [Lethenteron reissneri]|uniref:N-acetyllactosaminide beta-1,3-N-acetylglucosaminyltransferase 3-like n=1 Tax=Lethenteron reissneri TaxID=7753 RepID=UPI002AB76BD6|nr:N-acetyllactosaminide beta-1,3-N-acetylglucosaminyltransferase 3-like [Lethenteron reissneri]
MRLNSSPSSGRVLRFDSFVPSSSSPSPPTVGGEGEEVVVGGEEEEGQEGQEEEGAHQCRADPLVAQASPDFQALPWAYRQHLLYRHCRHFPLRIDQPEACAGTHGAPYLLLAIKSRVQDFGHRELVRQTWGAGGDHRVRRVFLLGTLPDSVNATFWDEFLRHESSAYGDLLQWGFHDTFLNLTLKETSFLRWFHEHCPRASFVLQCDADMLVSVPNALAFLRGPDLDPDDHLFAGDLIVDARPIRDPRSKYFIPDSLYGADRYPPYAGGGAFLVSRRTALALRRASDAVAPFPIDDVFLGMCLLQLGVTPQAHAGFRTLGLDRPAGRKAAAAAGGGGGGLWAARGGGVAKVARCLLRDLVAVHGLTPAQVWLAHRLVGTTGGCGRRASSAVRVVRPGRWWRKD